MTTTSAVLGLAQDGVADVRRLADDRLDVAVGVLADEVRQGAFRLGPDAVGDAGRDQVQGHDLARRCGGPARRRSAAPARRAGRRGSGTRIAARSRVGPPCLIDGDVARRVADDLVDRRREDRRSARPAWRAGLPAQPKTIRSASSSRRGLDDALGGAPPDPDDGVDRHAFRGVVEDALQQPAGLAGTGGAFAERRALGHLDDAEDGEAAGLAVHQRGADPDQLLRRSAGWRPG